MHHYACLVWDDASATMTVLAIFEAGLPGHRTLWAWCRTSGEGPGFEQIDYTEVDGVTPFVDGSLTEAPKLGRCVMSVVLPERYVAR